MHRSSFEAGSSLRVSPMPETCDDKGEDHFLRLANHYLTGMGCILYNHDWYCICYMFVATRHCRIYPLSVPATFFFFSHNGKANSSLILRLQLPQIHQLHERETVVCDTMPAFIHKPTPSSAYVR